MAESLTALPAPSDPKAAADMEEDMTPEFCSPHCLLEGVTQFPLQH